jgi:hypothetical protein
MHDDAIVFHNHTAGQRVAGAAAVREQIGAIFARWPTLRFERRFLRCGEDFAASEWTARAVHADDRRGSNGDGVDICPLSRRAASRARTSTRVRHAAGALASRRERRRTRLSGSRELLRRSGVRSGLRATTGNRASDSAVTEFRTIAGKRKRQRGARGADRRDVAQMHDSDSRTGCSAAALM